MIPTLNIIPNWLIGLALLWLVVSFFVTLIACAWFAGDSE